jgi:L-serine dehydratase
MPKENVSLFEIFGPVMIGPSSSHTAGVARIAFLTRQIFGGPPAAARVRFFGSLAATWRGHGSGAAAVAGLLGIPPEDERLARGWDILREEREKGGGFEVEICAEKDLPPAWHPNTVIFELDGSAGKDGKAARLVLRAASVGGGSIRIEEVNGYPLALSGENEALLVFHHDEVGVFADVSRVLAMHRINIAGAQDRRREKGEEALIVVETDGPIPETITNSIEDLPAVYRVIHVPAV